MTTFRRFAVVAALLTATTFAPGLDTADDHGDRDDRGRYGDRDEHGRYGDRDGRYDGRWERQSHLMQVRALRSELVELDRERADFYAQNGRRPWLLARYDAAWSVRRTELERRLEWLRVTARR